MLLPQHPAFSWLSWHCPPSFSFFSFQRRNFYVYQVIDLSSKTYSTISVFHIQYFHSLIARVSILVFFLCFFLISCYPNCDNVLLFLFLFLLISFYSQLFYLAQIRSRFDFFNLSLANSHNFMTSLMLFNVLLKASVPEGNWKQETLAFIKITKSLAFRITQKAWTHKGAY